MEYIKQLRDNGKKDYNKLSRWGIDTDSENRMVDSKDYRYALNIRNGIAYLKRTGGTTNVKGNEKIVKIVYPYTDVAPSGKNKCIGTYEDKQNATLIFFIWNSEGYHQIMRFYPDKKSTASPYGEVHQLCVYDFGWESWTKITSVDLVAGKLLYWCDNIKSRKLNIEKANLVEKQKSLGQYIIQRLISLLRLGLSHLLTSRTERCTISEYQLT